MLDPLRCYTGRSGVSRRFYTPCTIHVAKFVRPFRYTQYSNVRLRTDNRGVLATETFQNVVRPNIMHSHDMSLLFLNCCSFTYNYYYNHYHATCLLWCCIILLRKAFFIFRQRIYNVCSVYFKSFCTAYVFNRSEILVCLWPSKCDVF
jgi:hypothetical protein